MEYQLSQTVLNKLEQVGIPTEPLQDISDRTISGSVNFRDQVRARMTLDKEQEKQLLFPRPRVRVLAISGAHSPL